MGATYPVKVLLAMRSGNRCALPDCGISLVEDGDESDDTVIGQAAHIYGENPGNSSKKPSARFDPTITEEKINHYENLIYLCPTCHTKIDKQEKDYPVELLFKIKEEHETWVDEQLDEGMSKVTFIELEIASNSIPQIELSQDSKLTIITPEEKIKKNSLTVKSKNLISMGLSLSSEVKEFLSQMTKLDHDFTNKLKTGFQKEYKKLSKKSSGDELFYTMLKFSQRGQKTVEQRAASLALLSYLFHLCEIFEK